MKRWPRIIWYVLSLRCEEAERVRSADDAGGDAGVCCAGHQRLAERLHRLICRSCRVARRQMAAIGEALSDPSLESEADAAVVMDREARARIAASLENRSGTSGGGGGDRGA